mgnify:CR=1 FL=1
MSETTKFFACLALVLITILSAGLAIWTFVDNIVVGVPWYHYFNLVIPCLSTWMWFELTKVIIERNNDD